MSNIISPQLHRESQQLLNKYILLQLECLIIYLLDDFHNIHGIRVPTGVKMSKVAHMASLMIDIQPLVPAVRPPHTAPTHRPTTMEQGGQRCICPGGIDESAIKDIMGQAMQTLKGHFLDSLPTHMLQLRTEKLQESL